MFWLETVEDNSGQNFKKRHLKRAGFLHMHDEALRLLDGSDEVGASGCCFTAAALAFNPDLNDITEAQSLTDPIVALMLLVDQTPKSQ